MESKNFFIKCKTSFAYFQQITPVDLGPSMCGQYRSPSAPQGYPDINVSQCCTRCQAAADCNVWVHEDEDGKADTGGAGHCWLLVSAVGTRTVVGRTVGGNFTALPSFTNYTLRIEVKRTGTVWYPGDTPTGNMLGTQRSLDGTTGWQELRCWLPDAVKDPIDVRGNFWC